MSQDALAQLVFPCGKGGINRSKNFVDFPPTDLTMANGITVEHDTWRKEGGASRLHPNGIGYTIVDAYDYWHGGTQELVAVVLNIDNSFDLVTIDSTGIQYTLKTGSGISGLPVAFAEGWNGSQNALYIPESGSSILEYTGNGNPPTPIAAPNTDWAGASPQILFQHANRMWAAYVSSLGHDFFISKLLTHGVFNGSDTFRQSVYAGKGSGIRAAASWRRKVYAFKEPLGIYVLNDNASVDPANWSFDVLAESIGIASTRGWTEVDSDIIFMATDGYLYSLSQIEAQGEQSVRPILPLETSNFLRAKIRPDMAHSTQLLWYGHKRQLWVMATGVTNPFGDTLSERFVFDFHGPTPVFLYSTLLGGSSLRHYRESVAGAPQKPILCGHNAFTLSDPSQLPNGFIYQLDREARTKDGLGYTGQFETPPRPFFPDGIRKGNLEHLEVVFEPKGEWDVDMEIHRDGQLSQTIPFSQQNSGGAVGSFSLDGDVLGGTTIANKRMRALGDAQYVKLVGRNTGAGQDFSIQEMVLHFTPGAEAA